MKGRWPRNSFPLKRNDCLHEPNCNQYQIGNYRIGYNPDDDRFHLEQEDPEWPGEWRTISTFKNTAKGYMNAIDRMKREVHHQHK